ncbi:MAG: hypothetical protein IKN63_01935 [Bacilli bacterium]|nr:hypothetical protein [Bacilli bacterium]
MKFLRKNKYAILAIIVLIILVILGMKVKDLLVPDEGKAAYGQRLDDIKNHPLGDKLFEDITSKIKEDEKVLEVTHYVHGKIINLIITVNDEMDVQTAKSLANSTISLFSNNELSYYSLQVYVKKTNASLNNFPIVGYKGTEATELSFTKDRDITSNEG